ncbi:MAG: FGGY family carbohydrate kinase [Candidatus Bathyarchaeia archaeon]
MYLLGIDLGSTVCKSAIFNLDGTVKSIIGKEFSSALSSPHYGWLELNAEAFWKIVAECINESIKTAHINPKDIAGLSVSASGELFIPISKNGKPVCKAIYWSDKRAEGYRNQLNLIKKFDELKIYKITGYPLSPIPSLIKLLWLKQERQKLFNKIYKILLLEDFVNFKLTGNFATDYSLAMTSQMFDIKKKDWSQEILSEMKIDRNVLPNAYSSGKVIGELSLEASKETGLAVGTIVATGGLDQSCVAFGLGVINEGEAFNTTGTCEIVATVSNKPILTNRSFRAGVMCCLHVIENKYLPLEFLPSSGSTLKWFRDNFGEVELKEAKEKGVDAYSILIEKAAASQPGSFGIFMLPHFDGSGSGYKSFFNSESKGAFIGLTLSHKKGDVIRAILEGITFEARLYFEVLEKLGLKIKEVKAAGGGAKSKFWLQLKADIFNKKIILPNVTEAASLGAALLAGLACKIYSTPNKAVKEVCKKIAVFKPTQKTLILYKKCYEVFKKIYPTLLPLFKLMTKIN